METIIAQAVEVDIGITMARVMDQLVDGIFECIAQVVSNQIAKLITPKPTGPLESNKLPMASEVNTIGDKVHTSDNSHGFSECSSTCFTSTFLLM